VRLTEFACLPCYSGNTLCSQRHTNPQINKFIYFFFKGILEKLKHTEIDRGTWPRNKIYAFSPSFGLQSDVTTSGIFPSCSFSSETKHQFSNYLSIFWFIFVSVLGYYDITLCFESL
jgi:hypothetical protein